MRYRSVLGIFILTFITFGIYPIYWMVSTKDEMNRRGADVPTAWLIIIPIVSIYWMWRYCEGVEHVTRGKLSGPVSFLCLFFLSLIGMMIVQSELNRVGGLAATLPQARLHRP